MQNGSNPLEGRVEVCYNKAWGTICDTSFSTSDATVVCRQLGYRFIGTEVLPISEFSQGSGPIFLDQVACDGDEEQLSECGTAAPGLYTCSHNQDAAIRCIGEKCCMEYQCPMHAFIQQTIFITVPIGATARVLNTCIYYVQVGDYRNTLFLNRL